MKKTILFLTLLGMSCGSFARCYLGAYVPEHEVFVYKTKTPAYVDFSFNVLNDTEKRMVKRITYKILVSDSKTNWNSEKSTVLDLQPGERTKTVVFRENLDVYPTGATVNVHGIIESEGCEKNEHIRSFNTGSMPQKSNV